MVILIDRTAYGTQTIVAAGQHVGQRKLIKTRSAGSLNDAHIGQVMAGDCIELNFQVVGVAACVVGLEDAISDGTLFRIFFCDLDLSHVFFFRNQSRAVQKIHAGIVQCYHNCCSFMFYSGDLTSPVFFPCAFIITFS